MSPSTTPRVSILLPVFNASPFLGSCLRSIQRQTEGDFECLVVDDGSTDGSLEIARAMEQNDPRFRVLARPHRGLVSTLAEGTDHARGDLIARMDADDLMHRQRLALQAAALDRSPELLGVGCHVRCFPRENLGPGMREYERWLLAIYSSRHVRREAFVECPLPHPSLMMRRETLKAFGYRDRGWPEDYDLILRILGAGGSLGIVPKRLLLWRHRPERMSRVDPAYSIERFTACKAEFLARNPLLSSSDHYVLWGYGGTGRALRRALLAHGKRPSAIVELHPGRMGQIIHGAPVIPPEGLEHHLGVPLVVSVAGQQARQQIREHLSERNQVEGRDYVCAA
ncbi:glycosyltransferase [Myxococcota bacterium]|nr:glycosyltransferase [Myxococcota bacterium]